MLRLLGMQVKGGVSWSVFALWAASSLSALGCTTLGPMPSTTAVSVVPASRPAAEVQAALTPGYYLSSSVRESPKGNPIDQYSGIFEPDRVLGMPGLIAGARYVSGSGSGGYFEPLLGYRRFIDEDRRWAVGAVGYGTHARGEEKYADYSAWRGGFEAGLDVRITPLSHYLEVHAETALALSGLYASGHYCLDAEARFGVDCDDSAGVPEPTSARAHGFYPSANVGLALEFARHLDVFFHGGRLGLEAGAGTMPRLEGAEQKSAVWFHSAGLSLTLGFGSARE